MNTEGENGSPLLYTRDSLLARALLLNHGYRPNGVVIAQAAREGDLTKLKELWPHYQRCSNSQLVTHGLLYAAIKRRNIDLVSFFLDEVKMLMIMRSTFSLDGPHFKQQLKKAI